jgi:hypothetical protein
MKVRPFAAAAAPLLKFAPTRLLGILCLVGACSQAGGGSAVYPSRPPATPGEPIADPIPSRIVVHATITRAALESSLEEKLPQTGSGSFPLLSTERKFTWKRQPLAIHFNQGRVGFDLPIAVNVDMPISSLDLTLDLRVRAEPVITAEHIARLQSTEVTVSSEDKLVKVADVAAGVLGKIKKEIEAQLADFSYDLRPMIMEAYGRVAVPIPLPLGDAEGCAQLNVLSIEAGPTVLADGIEKDLALVVAPSVTLPCTAPLEPAPLPPLANVATLQPGPFTVTVPIAARYDELAKAMSLTFTDGKLFFSKEYPKLYMEKPEVYASKDQLVLKLHITGPITKFGIDTTLDGDLFLAGHPAVKDNELYIPDLEPTIETRSFLLKLKAALDGESIRDQARAALRLDIGERLKAVNDKLSTNLTFGNGQGCLKADAGKIEVTGVHPHGSYLRIYVAATGRASVYMPCL